MFAKISQVQCTVGVKVN